METQLKKINSTVESLLERLCHQPGPIVREVTTPSGHIATVIINPLRSTPSTRTAATVGYRAGQVIETSTVQRSATHSLLRSMSAPQESNMEPMPEFSRSVHYGSKRYAAAKEAAQRASETTDKSSSKTTDE